MYFLIEAILPTNWVTKQQSALYSVIKTQRGPNRHYKFQLGFFSNSQLPLPTQTLGGFWAVMCALDHYEVILECVCVWG